MAPIDPTMEWEPKPWLAALLGLIVPPIGMLYVQRPWWALLYFCLATGLSIGAILAGGLELANSSFLLRRESPRGPVCGVRRQPR